MKVKLRKIKGNFIFFNQRRTGTCKNFLRDLNQFERKQFLTSNWVLDFVAEASSVLELSQSGVNEIAGVCSCG